MLLPAAGAVGICGAQVGPHAYSDLSATAATAALAVLSAEAVESEWRLEKKTRPPGSLLIELVALLLLSWQLVDAGMAAADAWGLSLGGGGKFGLSSLAAAAGGAPPPRAEL